MFEDTDKTTAMEEAFEKAGVVKEETPQNAAERIWKETGHDPVETMKRFDEWARETPERMLAVIGLDDWRSHVRHWLGGHRASPTWKHNSTFRDYLYKKEKKGVSEEVLSYRARSGTKGGRVNKPEPSFKNQLSRKYRDRIKRGVKVVRAEVDAATGQVVNLIDKEYGPFAHIRINGLRLPEVTTDQALAYCDHKDTDNRFIRALCQMIPDPRKPIGEQWNADIIREAKAIAVKAHAA